jgi:hypothetical protein
MQACQIIDVLRRNLVSCYCTRKIPRKLEYTVKKGEANPVTGRGYPWASETSRLPHFLGSRLTDGDESVSLARRLAALYPQEDSWYSFLLEAESTPGPYCGWKDYVN